MKLVKFLQKLNREQVTIELKNGTVIQGTVVGVDATMNCHLKKAKVTVYETKRCRERYTTHNLCVDAYLYIQLFSLAAIFCFSLLSFRRGKNPVSHATLSVRGSTVRSFVLPESLNLDAMLVDDAPKKTPAPASALAKKSAGGMGRGRGRGRGRGMARR